MLFDPLAVTLVRLRSVAVGFPLGRVGEMRCN